MKSLASCLCLLAFTLAAPAPAATPLSLSVDPTSGGPGKFAAEEIRREAAARGLVLSATGTTAPVGAIQISLVVRPDARARPQSYGIRVQRANGRTTVSVQGVDAAGAMYGGLDLAEAIRTGTLESLRDSNHAPQIIQRGLKFNIPLDLRTPSYTDPSDAAQANIPEVWSMVFWREVMELARDRGVDVYWFTWNVFMFGAAGKDGLSHAKTAPSTIAYFRATYTRQYVQPVLYNRAGVVDLPQQTTNVAEDVQMARDWKPATINDAAVKRSGTEAGFRK